MKEGFVSILTKSYKGELLNSPLPLQQLDLMSKSRGKTRETTFGELWWVFNIWNHCASPESPSSVGLS